MNTTPRKHHSIGRDCASQALPPVRFSDWLHEARFRYAKRRQAQAHSALREFGVPLPEYLTRIEAWSYWTKRTVALSHRRNWACVLQWDELVQGP